jgi:hypothetical protein
MGQENNFCFYNEPYYNKVKRKNIVFFFKIKLAYFDCDRDNLSRGYEDYDFAKHFSRRKLD